MSHLGTFSTQQCGHQSECWVSTGYVQRALGIPRSGVPLADSQNDKEMHGSHMSWSGNWRKTQAGGRKNTQSPASHCFMRKDTCRFWGKPLPSKLPWDLSMGKTLMMFPLVPVQPWLHAPQVPCARSPYPLLLEEPRNSV